MSTQRPETDADRSTLEEPATMTNQTRALAEILKDAILAVARWQRMNASPK